MVYFCFAGQEGFECGIFWLMLILLFFLNAIVRKWIAETIGHDFSLIGSTVGSVITSIIVIYITHSMKFSFILGLIAGIILGFVSGPFMPDSEGSDSGGDGGWF